MYCDKAKKKNKEAIAEVLRLFETLEIGQRLKLEHKDDAVQREGVSRWHEVNCHDAVVVYKNKHLITVKETNGKRQSISFNQILSKAVTIQKGA